MDLAAFVTFGLAIPIIAWTLWCLPHMAISDKQSPLSFIWVAGYRLGLVALLACAAALLVEGLRVHDFRSAIEGACALAILIGGTWHAVSLRRKNGDNAPTRLDLIEYLLVAGTIIGLHGFLIYAYHLLVASFSVVDVSQTASLTMKLVFTALMFILGFFTTSAAVKVLARCLDEQRRGVAAVDADSAPLTFVGTRGEEYALVMAPIVVCLFISLFALVLIPGVLWRLVVLGHGWLKTELPPAAQVRLIPGSFRPAKYRRALERERG
jgi:hypothetical protein